MKPLKRCALVAFFIASSTVQASDAVERHAADVATITLAPQEKRAFNLRPGKGFVVVALEDCSIRLNGKSEALRAGDFRQTGENSFGLENTSSEKAIVVLVAVRKKNQPFTIQRNELDSDVQSEDASERNDTLIVALTPIRIRDIRDLATEGNEWISAPHRIITLKRGETAWLQPGMHRLRNLGLSRGRFLTVEW